MTIEQFRDTLKLLDISRSECTIDDFTKANNISVRDVNGIWEVAYFSERGEHEVMAYCDSESDAVEYVLFKLLKQKLLRKGAIR